MSWQNSSSLLQNIIFDQTATGSINMANEIKIHCGLIQDECLNETLTKFREAEEI